jgi:hypothetical protein
MTNGIPTCLFTQCLWLSSTMEYGLDNQWEESGWQAMGVANHPLTWIGCQS